MNVLLRLFPFIVAIIQVAVFFEQLRHPLMYPWIVLIGVLALPLAAAAIAGRRIRFSDMVEKMAPSFLLLAALAFALLLAESREAIAMILVLAGVSSLMSLELLFLYAFDSPRYPVNGLSRLNIAYVPIAVWYAAATSNGLLIFLHVPRVWHVVLMAAIGAILFRTTEHPQASRTQNAIWALIGAMIGLHVGLLGVLLPVSMPMHGVIAAFLMSCALRVRRYKYDPKPSKRQAWVEASSALAAFSALLVTAKWL